MFPIKSLKDPKEGDRLSRGMLIQKTNSCYYFRYNNRNTDDATPIEIDNLKEGKNVLFIFYTFVNALLNNIVYANQDGLSIRFKFYASHSTILG